MHVTSLLSVAALALGISAEGINCHGSSNCANVGFKLTDLLGYAQGLNNDRWYQNGQHIACWKSLSGSGFCAFLQNTGGLPGREIKRLLQELVNHGCAKCGSVPAFYPSDNDISHHGMLTVNFVSKTNCNGIC
ncbi:killer toxin [Ilyonectria robusta]|uniref:killer toxin n=1 Tax=Ilyonectria robusta TaxID=1079257 RepID=UPI001E8D563E|nr:killer toxin [Ilyonectria robusta]KAH8669358.1 killer toxin [Ilyonectria robusta]